MSLTQPQTSTSDSLRTGSPLFYNKAFFGKTSCLKITQNTFGEVYFHFGLDNKGWTWKKVKFSDSELAQIIQVLKGTSNSVSFFHKFNNENTQIWINRRDDSVNFKTKHSSRTLFNGELLVLEIMLTNCILRSCMV